MDKEPLPKDIAPLFEICTERTARAAEIPSDVLEIFKIAAEGSGQEINDEVLLDHGRLFSAKELTIEIVNAAVFLKPDEEGPSTVIFRALGLAEYISNSQEQLVLESLGLMGVPEYVREPVFNYVEAGLARLVELGYLEETVDPYGFDVALLKETNELISLFYIP